MTMTKPSPTISDDELLRIYHQTRHEIELGRRDVAAEKRERIAARLTQLRRPAPGKEQS